MATPPRPPSSAPVRQPNRSGMRDPDIHEEKLPPVPEDAMLKVLQSVIHVAVRTLAILTTLVILWGVADVVYVLYQRLVAPPLLLLTVSDLLAVFGSILSVLIAVEIFISITFYIRHDVLPIKLVLATALMAISRKVIMLDVAGLDWPYIVAIAAVIIALGLAYWLISYKPKPIPQEER